METIVLAVILHEGKLLVENLRESAHVDFAGISIVLPGGRPLPGESFEAAVVRKVKEETGITVAVTEKIAERVHPLLPDKRMIYYSCSVRGDPKIIPSHNPEIESVHWIGIREVGNQLRTLYTKVYAYLLDTLAENKAENLQNLPKTIWMRQDFSFYGEKIRAGELVAFPTETVYGLGANAYSAEAVLRIFRAKQRPVDNPLIVHIPSISALETVAEEVSETAERLFSIFSPGPLTVLVKKRPDIPSQVTAGSSLVGVRIPNHMLALEFLQAASVPVAAPSANISGKPSATHHEHVYEAFGEAVQHVIKGGFTQHGVESTVVLPEEDVIYILRQGAITQEQIQQTFPNKEVVFAKKDDARIKASPGTKYRHYAPKASITIVPLSEVDSMEHEIENAITLAQRNNEKVGVIAASVFVRALESQYEKDDKDVVLFDLGDFDKPEEAAKCLYDHLLDCDKQRITTIITHAYPETGIGRTVMERLRRASEG